MGRVRRRAESPLVLGSQARFAHHSSDAVPATVHAQGLELAVDARAAIGLPRLLVDGPNLRQQLAIFSDRRP